MPQTIITAGDAIGGVTSLAGGNDGTLALIVGPAGSKVSALSIDAAGKATFATPLSSASKVQLTSGNINTTSTTLVDVTGASLAVTTKANNRLLVSATFSWNHNTNLALIVVNVLVDGILQLGTDGLGLAWGTSRNENGSFSFLTDVLSAGAHTIKLQWRTNTGTANINANTANAFTFSAMETA